MQRSHSEIFLCVCKAEVGKISRNKERTSHLIFKIKKKIKTITKSLFKNTVIFRHTQAFRQCQYWKKYFAGNLVTKYRAIR